MSVELLTALLVHGVSEEAYTMLVETHGFEGELGALLYQCEADDSIYYLPSED